MQLSEINGYTARLPTTGGKAGKGKNVTSTIQVLRGQIKVAEFRFTISDPDSRRRAVQKARAFMLNGERQS